MALHRSDSKSSSRRSTSSRFESLYEFNYLPEDSKIPLTDLPFLNPYDAFSKPSKSFSTSLRHLVSPPKPSSVLVYF